MVNAVNNSAVADAAQGFVTVVDERYIKKMAKEWALDGVTVNSGIKLSGDMFTGLQPVGPGQMRQRDASEGIV